MAVLLSPAGIVHLSAVVPALILGAVMLLRSKGTPQHQCWGRAWAALMVTADVSSFWRQRDGYSWIHLLALVNLASIAAGIGFIRAGRRRAHAACVIGAYGGALLAGAGALAPGRFLHHLLLGG